MVANLGASFTVQNKIIMYFVYSLVSLPKKSTKTKAQRNIIQTENNKATATTKGIVSEPLS